MATKAYGLPAGSGPEQLLLFSGTIGGQAGDWEPVTVVGSDGTPLDVTLTSRMLAKAPQAGYRIYLDTSRTDYVYILENVAGTALTVATWQGIRLPLDANLNIVGVAQEGTGVKASDYTGTWS